MSSNTKQVSPLAPSIQNQSFHDKYDICSFWGDKPWSPWSYACCYLRVGSSLCGVIEVVFFFIKKVFDYILYSSFQLLMALKKVYICVVWKMQRLLLQLSKKKFLRWSQLTQYGNAGKKNEKFFCEIDKQWKILLLWQHQIFLSRDPFWRSLFVPARIVFWHLYFSTDHTVVEK